MAPLLTTDDLDDLGADALDARDPRPAARRIVAAVDDGGLADPDDAGYALSLAGDLYERAGDHDEALALSARSVTAGAGTDDATWLHAMHADRLLRAGRDDEGMAALTTLRPRLHREASAVAAITDALTENGRAELAEQWLTAALHTAVEREERATSTSGPDSDEQLEAADVVDELVTRRRHVRAHLGLPADEYDVLAEEMDAAPDLVFFPEAELTRLLAALPGAAGDLGADWDAHRALVEGELQDAAAEGEVLDVEVATPALVAAIIGETDADPVGEPLAWPPGRNDPCWCGSGAKYKKCCLPRTRETATPAVPPADARAASPGPAPSAPTSSERVIKRGAGTRSRAR
ncbi:hypothetical protein Acsp06_30690 [Actinomycetospora sp. NBRC 106375]|uniref:SEC-C domain-containing protein n=1 Tax=Actinomycetospora sp. NBRC 106375 TaxID=3032207 RepID=UPI0024A53E51|nr:SEC-C domain-containing protein [Actinomycetospora sp. NBRC 106375]GLZ46884.1 hypothetical protein Acsp06_30690 [Actinomycetospora sp. NBRC 106375]